MISVILPFFPPEVPREVFQGLFQKTVKNFVDIFFQLEFLVVFLKKSLGNCRYWLKFLGNSMKELLNKFLVVWRWNCLRDLRRNICSNLWRHPYKNILAEFLMVSWTNILMFYGPFYISKNCMFVGFSAVNTGVSKGNSREVHYLSKVGNRITEYNFR